MDRPPAPPEAVIIRLAREAAGITISDAAKRAGVSVARWSQIETGSEMRRGTVSPVTARAGTIARMAHAVPGITPERMETEGRRPDAAAILREIISAPAAAPRAAAIPEPGEPAPRPRSFTDVDKNDPELRPFLESVTADLLRAIGIDPIPGRVKADDEALDELVAPKPGEEIPAFSKYERALWDNQGLTAEQKRHTIAKMRRYAAEWQSGQRNPRLGLLTT